MLDSSIELLAEDLGNLADFSTPAQKKLKM